MAEAGQLVGDYQVLAQLGAGGMGRVYKVRNVISNREEAMKILLPDFASDKDLAARFMAEIRTLATLEHPGIAQLRTAFQSNNQFVMVMEYVEGTTLEKLAAATRIPVDKVLDYAGQVLEALSYAHSRGVIHRDIKPANIMITTHGLVKLMDFGIAKSTEDMQLTRPGTTMGSVYYMSPEQVRGGAIDARSDLYSFGVTLYEMLTGRKPFQADTSYTVLNAQLNQAPTPPVEVNPAIPAALNDIILRAMAKLPEQRFQTANEFRDAVRAVRGGQTVGSAGIEPAVGAPAMAASAQWSAVAGAGLGAQGSSAAFAATAAVPGSGAGAAGWTPMPVPAVQGGDGGSLAAPARIVGGGGGKSNRGLWIVLGAVTAILALAAVATFLPRLLSGSKQNVAASGSSQAPTASAPTPQPEPGVATAPAAVDATTAQPASTPSQNQKPAAVQKKQAERSAPAMQPAAPTSRQPYQPAMPAEAQTSTPGAAAAQAVATATPPPGPSRAEMNQAQERLNNLQARADAAIAGVEQIRSQQQASGFDIRGDVLATLNRLRNHLRDAERGLQTMDLEGANSSMQHGEAETATLEKFLGR